MSAETIRYVLPENLDRFQISRFAENHERIRCLYPVIGGRNKQGGVGQGFFDGNDMDIMLCPEVQVL